MHGTVDVPPEFVLRGGVHLRGSHRLGRIDDGIIQGGQVGAAPTRVEQPLKHLETVYAEMDPGDCLYFHCNPLNGSEQNRSPNRRWTVLFCHNTARNNPYIKHHHPFYTPLEKVPDSAIDGSVFEIRQRRRGKFPEQLRQCAGAEDDAESTM